MFTWVDAGLRSGDDAGRLVEAGADVAILASETIRGPRAIERAIRTVGRDRLAFSLDVRAGRPLLPGLDEWGTDDPSEILATALEFGIPRAIVLDVARVGLGGGFGMLDVLTVARPRWPLVDFGLGGGLAGLEDIAEGGRAGANFVLVGSALHDGRLAVGHPE